MRHLILKDETPVLKIGPTDEVGNVTRKPNTSSSGIHAFSANTQTEQNRTFHGCISFRCEIHT